MVGDAVRARRATGRSSGLRHEPAVFTAAVRACPLHAHWLDGEPITGVLPMGGVLDRRRRRRADAVTGVALVGDAWACTNPSLGRGMALGLAHAALLRDTMREHAGDPAAFARGLGRGDRARAGAVVRGDGRRRPRAARGAGRGAHGRARTGARRPGVAAAGGAAAAMGVDAEAFRAGLEIIDCLTLPSEVFARPGLAERVIGRRGGARRRAGCRARARASCWSSSAPQVLQQQPGDLARARRAAASGRRRRCARSATGP